MGKVTENSEIGEKKRGAKGVIGQYVGEYVGEKAGAYVGDMVEDQVKEGNMVKCVC